MSVQTYNKVERSLESMAANNKSLDGEKVRGPDGERPVTDARHVNMSTRSLSLIGIVLKISIKC